MLATDESRPQKVLESPSAERTGFLYASLIVIKKALVAKFLRDGKTIGAHAYFINLPACRLPYPFIRAVFATYRANHFLAS